METQISSEPSAVANAKDRINVRCTNGSKFSVELDLTWTVGALKALLAEKCDIAAHQQRLIYKGRVLKDDSSLQSYGLQSDHTIHLVRGAPSTADAGRATGPAKPSPTAPIGSLPRNAGPVGINNGSESSLLPGSGQNIGGGLGTGFPDFQQMQQQLMQNPNLMREIMNTPAIQSLLNNPDLVRNMIMNNSQIRDIIDRNPGLAHVLNDPATLRQTLDAARNPELMREMMRNTDRAMSNIESSPEGFNMLRRMYETVQEPFLNAATMGTEGANSLASNPLAVLLGGQGIGLQQNENQQTNASSMENVQGSVAPNTAPLPNPWNPSQNAIGAGGAANARSPTNVGGLGALGGLGSLDLGTFGGGFGVPDPTTMQQMLQNPAISQMMQGLLPNPQYINQLMNLQPHLQTIMNSNPQFREMLQSPEFLRQISSPESLMQMLQLQRAILPHLNNQEGQNNSGFATPNNLDLNSLLGALGGAPARTPEVNSVPPEQLYASQLSHLQDMGFVDVQANIQALRATGGNVHAAVERLLGNI